MICGTPKLLSQYRGEQGSQRESFKKSFSYSRSSEVLLIQVLRWSDITGHQTSHSNERNNLLNKYVRTVTQKIEIKAPNKNTKEKRLKTLKKNIIL